ncbi:MAG: VPLPA-CTERM sorting domain-containing protein [Nitrospirales bacterium]|nr:VPLPA-CTERM sorting domain-containing protein [Nitrospirales bacterium]
MFETSDTNTGAGSGHIQSFLRTQKNGSEAGFNTDARPFNLDQVTGNFTRSLMLSDLAVVDVGGTDYFELRLDINEPGGAQSLITLQELELWVHTTPDDNDYSDGLGTKVYDLGGNTVLMDNGVGGSAGSGDFDYDVLFPTAILSGFSPDNFLYLYNVFGDTDMMSEPSQAGFEEWAAVTNGPTPVPVPSAVWLFGTGLIGLIGITRRKNFLQNK